jgi:hypothetical protein
MHVRIWFRCVTSLSCDIATSRVLPSPSFDYGWRRLIDATAYRRQRQVATFGPIQIRRTVSVNPFRNAERHETIGQPFATARFAAPHYGWSEVHPASWYPCHAKTGRDHTQKHDLFDRGTIGAPVQHRLPQQEGNLLSAQKVTF